MSCTGCFLSEKCWIFIPTARTKDTSWKFSYQLSILIREYCTVHKYIMLRHWLTPSSIKKLSFYVSCSTTWDLWSQAIKPSPSLWHDHFGSDFFNDSRTWETPSATHRKYSLEALEMLFCFVLMRSTKPVCFRSHSWSLQKALKEVHRLGFMVFGLVV